MGEVWIFSGTTHCTACLELRLFHVEVNLKFHLQITQFVNSEKTFTGTRGRFFLIIITQINSAFEIHRQVKTNDITHV